MSFSHIPVLLEQCVTMLNIDPDGIYADCTAGGGGHSLEIVKRLKNGCLICIDRDQQAIAACDQRLSGFKGKYTMVHSPFSRIKEILNDLGIDKIDGALLDLGVSSHQIDRPERGFTFQTDAPLDMRMDTNADFDAKTLVNTCSKQEIADILWQFGEERYSRAIAERIVKARVQDEITTTGQLTEIIKSAMPAAARREQHPAKRSFQALRIAVNNELGEVTEALSALPGLLNPGGRIAVISFHSLEDRIVKTAFAGLARGCTCPREFPVCVCGNKPIVKIISKKPITATSAQLEKNPRAASAKLRVAQRI